MTHVIDELVEDALRELADEETQTRLWQASGGEVSSLIECTSRLWDDSGLAMAMERGIVYSASIDAHLRQLRSALHRIDGYAPIQVVLASLDLREARACARALLEELSF